VIRHVSLFSLKEGVPAERLDAVVRAMKAIRFDGCTRWELVRDLRLREGNLPYAFVAEFDDEAAYRAYDTNADHDRVRRELIRPIVARMERIQYEVR
jgi:hypothetical protein